VTVIPMVPRISPFDLVYLDREHRVVERVELLPATEIPRFKKPASSALVLPFRTISSTKIEVGHEFRFEEIDESEAAASAEPEPPAAPLQVVKPQPAASLAVLPVAQIAAQADAPLLNPFLAMTAEPKAVEVPVKVEARTPIKTNKEFDLADFLRSNSGSAAASAEVAFPVVQEQPLLTMPAPKRKARKAQPSQNPDELPASPRGRKQWAIDSFGGCIRLSTTRIDASLSGALRRGWWPSTLSMTCRACMKWPTSVPAACISIRRNDGSRAQWCR
jgi:hypothetical protein